MNDETTSTPGEQAALELLPWFVNGTLEGEERETVQRALRSSITVRREHERLSRLQAVVKSDDAELAATDRGFERLMARIAADDAAGVTRPAAQARTLRSWPLAQAAAVLALVSGVVWWLGRGESAAPAGYVTLTREAQGGPQLRLVFAPDIDDAERQALLKEFGLTQAAPPTPEGLYTLAPAANADAGAIAARLREDPRVAFVTTPPVREAN